MYTQTDHQMMRRALALAQRAFFHATPNPRVGCVIARDGRVLGEGWTQAPGSNHAEVEALLDARRNGADLHGATAYVTLEPCSHFGRTPPCATALIEARLARVIAAVEDPNPQVSGRGLAMLRANNVDVRCGLLAAEAVEQNLGFFSRMNRGRPWLRMKIAASLDGRTALPDGTSRWITSEQARADGHAWRARACAVLTGIGTVKADDPQLNVRLVDTPRQPMKVVIDSRLQISPQARILDGAPVVIACAFGDFDKAAALRDRGAEVLELPDAEGRVDLPALLNELARRGVNELHAEAGFNLNGALARQDLVDELLVYIAPMLIGEGAGMLDVPAVSDLTAAHRLQVREVSQVGGDIRLLARWTPELASP